MSAKIRGILLPGLCDDERVWQHVAAELRDLAEFTFVPLNKPTTIRQMAELALSASSGQVGILGFSMGGYVAFEMWRQAKERIEWMVLLSTSARPDTIERSMDRQRLIHQAEDGNYGTIVQTDFVATVEPSRVADEDLRRRLAAMALTQGSEVYVRQMKAIMARADSRRDLIGIDVPTAILCGKDDHITPPELSEEIAAGIRGSELHLIPNCGHYLTLERPSHVEAVIRRFLSHLRSVAPRGRP
jgi:pimeloyl-ACP methyl ester carboxylesterase